MTHPLELDAWRRRKPGRSVEHLPTGAVVLVDPLPENDLSSKLGTGELRRAYPSITAACAAV